MNRSPAAIAFGGLASLPRANKYGARRVSGATRPDGLSFDSQAEEARYDTLRLMEKAGEIVAGSIRTQVRYELGVNGVHVCHYIADFVYVRADGVEVCEDVKGVHTPVFALKKKLMRALHGVAIHETGRTAKKKRKR